MTLTVDLKYATTVWELSNHSGDVRVFSEPKYPNAVGAWRLIHVERLNDINNTMIGYWENVAILQESVNRELYPPPRDIFKDSVNYLELSVRACHILDTLGVTNLYELIKLDVRNLRKGNGSAKVEKEIHQALVDYLRRNLEGITTP